MQIEDGVGRGFLVSVSESHRLNVSAKTAPRPFYIARDDGRAFALDSIVASAAAGNIVLYLKNTSDTRNMFVDVICVSALNAALWKLSDATGTAAGGSVLVPGNLNRGSSLLAEVDSRGDGSVTGTASSARLGAVRSAASSSAEFTFGGSLILVPNQAIQVEYDAGTTGAAEVAAVFHYEDVGRAN